MTDGPHDWSPQYCDDAVFVPAPAETVFAALLDVERWHEWWVMMRFEPARSRPLEVGDTVLFDGAVVTWTVVVEAIDPPRAIRFRYQGGALVGDTEWRVTPEPGGCRASYIYLGVRAGEDRAATTFGRFGTRFHTMVMQADALSGLVRLVTGQPLDEAWRQSVRDKVAEDRAKLIAEQESV